MSTTVNRVYRLKSRPEGSPVADNLELVEEIVPDPEPGQALVRTCYLSVDPTTRVWMSDYRGYMPPVPLGEVMRGVGVGQVEKSRRDDLPEGAIVLGWPGWQEYCLTNESSLVPLEFPFLPLPDPLPAPPSAFAGVLGHTGLTAHVGIDIGKPHPGDTAVVSAAAGAVGSIAGQLAKAAGATVVGIAGGHQKCRHVVDTLGFDHCIDRHAQSWREDLAAATPDGIDLDFENVGGEIMDAVLLRLNVGARVVLCGMIAAYNRFGSVGQHDIIQFVMQRASLHGFLVLDHLDRVAEAGAHLGELIAAGKLHYDETIVDGLEKAPDALSQILDGENLGKMIVRVSETL
ncbi:NADP-dependent oxidoreductase [Actinomycetospora sp. CA-101289]|uniref:NADP-dependent oxidoreductase n=1 Tax=Actinomycetospora sp. CA-101289 TaxID=3239893 RepID=UPI003D965716